MLGNTEGAIQKWTIQRYWQNKVHKTKKNKTKTLHNTQTNINNVNKTWTILQTGGKDEYNNIWIKCLSNCFEHRFTYNYLNKNSWSQSSISIGLNGDVRTSVDYSHFKHQYIIWNQIVRNIHSWLGTIPCHTTCLTYNYLNKS